MNKSKLDNSYSVYIHIPFCISKCSYCDFFSVPTGNCNKNAVPDDYVNALCNEITTRLDNSFQYKSIYIGGGTPSLLSARQIQEIFSALKNQIKNFNDIEITMECNPDDVSESFLNLLQTNGVNRISCGIQSLNNKVLHSLNRRASLSENLAALSLIKKYWKGKISIDIISSLPGESEDSFLQGINYLLIEKPHHISMYALTIEEETPLGQDYYSGNIDYDFDIADEIWLKGKKLLLNNGYKQYEVSNFCLPGYECVHNSTYWKHENYIGLGSGATGTVYNEKGSLRITNTTNIIEYIKYWSLNKDAKNHSNNVQIIEEIDSQTDKFEFFMMGLRTCWGISKIKFEKTYRTSFPEKVAELFDKWQEKGLAVIEISEKDVVYKLNEEGLLFLNKFLEDIEL